MSKFPEKWITEDLEKCVEILDNKRIPINSEERAKRQGDIPYYGATGQAGWIDDFIFNEELVLVGEDGAPFFEKEKTVAFMINGKSWVNNHAHVLKAIEGITLNNFVLHYLNHFDYKDFVGGTTRLKLNQGSLKKIPFPLPPIAEQKRIVAKLDTLFTHLDQLKARLENIPTLIKQFRQAVLTQAVTGKLTEEWRKENELSSEEYVNSVIERRKDSISKKKGALSINLRSDLELFALPNSWIWCDLEFLFDEEDNFCYGVVQPGSNVEDEQKLIRVQDLENGKILVDQLRGISWRVDNEFKRSKVKPNDLLVTIVGTIGRTAIVSEEENGFNIARAVAKIPIKDFSTRYVKLLIDSKFGQTWLNDDAREVARKTLNLDQLRTLPIPIPHPIEQNEIVRRVESLFAIAYRIEARYHALQEKMDYLPQAILSKAFRGELIN